MAEFESKSNKKYWVKQDTTAFSIGDVIHLDSGSFTKALDGDSDLLSLVRDVVVSGASGCMLVQSEGNMKWEAHGLTIGSKYYISSTVAGSLTITKPTDDSRMVIIPINADEVLVGDDGR